MKNPNGYGSIFKLSGKRRAPFAVRITAGWSNDAKQKYKYIGYYATRSEAMNALASYNISPYDLEVSKITLKDVYEKWANEKLIVKDSNNPHGIAQSNINGYRAAWKLCSIIEDVKFVDIKLSHLQEVVDKSGKNFPTLRKLKVLFSQLFDYAVIHEIITKDRDIVEYVNINKAGNPNAYNRKPFTREDVQTVWNWSSSSEYVQVILMLIYSGVRIGELLELRKTNVNLKEKWFDVEKSKTNAGIRKVPISDKTIHFFENWYNKNDSEFLITTKEDKKFKYTNYYDAYWKPYMKQMGLEYTPHCTRYTCISFLTAAGVDDRIIKKIVGHKGNGITQALYTHLEIVELQNAVNKI